MCVPSWISARALRKLPAEVGVNALLLWLTVKALQDVPQFNATYERGTLWQHAHIDLAQAVALPDGLLTPVLRQVEGRVAGGSGAALARAGNAGAQGPAAAGGDAGRQLHAQQPGRD